MSTDPRYLLEVISQGNGLALDLGGGRGEMRQPLSNLGYQYVNLDIRRSENGEPSVLGSAQSLPFRRNVFELVVSKDSLEHFLNPWAAVQEVYRVLRPSGFFVIWVPFMHPFHSNDAYRYSPLALEYMLQDFVILRFESPLWVCTVIGLVIISVLKRLRLERLERPVRSLCARLDRVFTNRVSRPLSFAAAYRLVVKKKERSV